MTALATQILATIEANPGLTSNALVRKLGARKTDALSQLRRLCEQGSLRFETGQRAARYWYLVSEAEDWFPSPRESSEVDGSEQGGGV